MRIAKVPNGLRIDQSKLLEKILDKFDVKGTEKYPNTPSLFQVPDDSTPARGGAE